MTRSVGDLPAGLLASGLEGTPALIGLTVLVGMVAGWLWCVRLIGRASATERRQPAALAFIERWARRAWAVLAGRRAERWLGWALKAPYEDQAVAYLEEAARLGSVEALFEQALYWAESGQGLGGEDAARRWMRRAAELGHAEAAFHLAEMLRWGRGGRRDREEAHRWYLRSAQRGFAPAYAWLASAFETGDGTDPDSGEAARWRARLDESAVMPSLRRSRIAGAWDANPEPLGRAREHLGQAWAGGLEALSRTRAYDHAVKVFAWTGIVLLLLVGLLLVLLSLSGGLFALVGAVALAGLTQLHLQQRRSVRWSSSFRKLEARAQAGDAMACHDLGRAYLQGAYPVPLDPAAGQAWLGRAAAQGHVEAMLALAEVLAWGQAGMRDRAGAEAWLRKAQAAGSPEAAARLKAWCMPAETKAEDSASGEPTL